MGSPIYEETVARHPDVQLDDEVGRDPATTMLPAVEPITYGVHADWPAGSSDPPSVTAGEQDHSDPWRYAGADAAAPVNP